MATKKVTITLEEEQLEAIRAMVESGRAKSVSGFLQHAVRISLNDAREWGLMLDEMLTETGGPLTDEERRWADEILNATPNPHSSVA